MLDETTEFNILTDMILPYGGTLLVIGLVIWLTIKFLAKRTIAQATAHAADLVILQVLIPKDLDPKEETERRKDFKDLMSVAEQFFASLSAITPLGGSKLFMAPPVLAFEIIAKQAIRFYIGVPQEHRELLEKQVLAYYPTAAIEENDDFRIFDEKLVGVGMEIMTTKRFVLPVKTYKELESDPLNSLTNAFSKMGDSAHGALQLLIRPTNGQWQQQVSHAARAVQDGEPVSIFTQNWFGRTFKLLFHGAGKTLRNQDNQPHQPVKLTPMQDEILKDLNEKSAKVGYEVQIRALVLAPTQQEAQTHLSALATVFAQFQSPRGNSFRAKPAKNFKDFSIFFLLRTFTAGKAMILNTEELTTLYHFPTRYLQTPTVQWLLARTIAPPVNLPGEGMILGKSVFRGEEKLVRIKVPDRGKHLYMIGKTGTGKTTMFTNMIEQDIKAGNGCAYFDPNGDAIETILNIIPPERADDVILFDPSDTQRPFGLNMLEWKRPEDRDFLVAEWIEIFYKLFDPNRTGMVGPQFEHWGRNASLTVMNIPGGGTLIDIPRLFMDDKFREMAVKNVTDPIVRSFWEQQMAKTSDFHKSEMYNYFNSKFGRFMTNDLVRNIIGQTKSSFDMRDIMDNGKILLVNLSKGKIGETNSSLFGMILISKLQVAAFQRADIKDETQRRDFYLYVDEFQNFTTGSFKTILSEARKYHLNLNITNQYIAQLPEDIRDAVIGNAGTLMSYRIGAADAEFLEKEFPGITKEDMTNVGFANLYIKLLIDGTPTKPFSVRGIKSSTPPNLAMAEAIRQLSRLKYGRPSARVQAEFQERIIVGGSSVPEPIPADNLQLA